jgi:hypothetical protein
MDGSLSENSQREFVEKMVAQSDLSRSFWQQVADKVWEGRKKFGAPNTVLGSLSSLDDAMGFLVERNNNGIALEKAGQVDVALLVYEVSVADAFFGTQPYDRLRIHYTKRGLLRDALRVCWAYVNLHTRQHGQDKDTFRKHIRKLEAKLRTAPSQ